MVAWYGDMDMASHAWKLLGLGPLDAYVAPRAARPIPRPQGARALRQEKVRKDVVELLRGPRTV